MTPQRLTAKDLYRRYRSGERNFSGIDLSGQSLRGMNLKGIDLSGADLSRTDIRGTKFVNATLRETVFSQAQAGLQRRWLIGQLAISLPLAMVLNFLGALFSGVFIAVLFEPASIEEYTIISGLLVLVMLMGMLLVIARQGLTFKALNTIIILIAFAFALGSWQLLGIQVGC